MSHDNDHSKSKQKLRSTKETRIPESTGGKELQERRITPRRELEIVLTVYGRSASGTPFYEQAKVVRGNANGGLLLLAVPVTEGQDLLLINNTTTQEQICNVVEVCVRDIQMNEVSVSFPLPNSEFWKPSGNDRNG